MDSRSSTAGVTAVIAFTTSDFAGHEALAVTGDVAFGAAIVLCAAGFMVGRTTLFGAAAVMLATAIIATAFSVHAGVLLEAAGIASGLAIIALAVAFIGPRAIIVRVQQMVEWATQCTSIHD